MADTKKLDSLWKQVEKDHGKSVLPKEDDNTNLKRVELTSPALNYVLGGGMPIGRIIELFGKESGGKSLISMSIARDYQAQGHFVVYVDLEYSFDYAWARKIGLDTGEDLFRLIQPDTGEDAFEIVQAVAKTGEVGLIIIDSVSAMTTRQEVEGNMGDAHMGGVARLMGQGLRKTTSVLAKNECTAIFINQIREKIGVMFGNPETTSGGNALKFFASIRCDVRRIEDITEGKDNIIGMKARFKNIKNKTAPPKRRAEIEIYFDRGLDPYREYIDFGVTFGLLEKAGSWYTMPDGERFQGKDSCVKHLRENQDLLESFRARLAEKMFPVNGEVEPEEEVADDSEDEVFDEDQ